MDIAWITDEHGTRTFEHEGWRVSWVEGYAKPAITGCGGISSIEIDDDTGELEVDVDTDHAGTCYLYIPAVILWIAQNCR